LWTTPAVISPFDPWQGLWAAGDVFLSASMTAQQLADRQAQRLRALLASAARGSPLYGRLFTEREAAHLPLSELPVMHKADLMRHFDDWGTDRRLRLDELQRFTADPTRIADPYLGRYVVWESSGTSGSPAIFVQDPAAMAVYDALEAFRRPFTRPLERWLDPWSRSERIAFVGATHGHFASIVSVERMRRLNTVLSARLHNVSFMQPTQKLARQLEEIAPSMVATYPSEALLLAEEQAGARLNIHPREIWVGGETVTPAMRDLIQKSFGCGVIESYGASEFLTLACECRLGRLHLNADWVILEPVDAQGQPVAPGERSTTTLLTNLANHVQPLIRYDLGDRVTFSPAACECGSSLPVIRVEGRSGSTLRLQPEGGAAVRVSSLALSTLIEDEAGLFDFQLEQTGPHSFELRTPLQGPSAMKTLRRARTGLAALLAQHGAPAADIHLIAGCNNRRGPGGKVQRVVAWSP
jgi:phenylacetate-CoA ligase